MTTPPMRRRDRAISDAEAMRLLETCEYGILSTVGPENTPYGVPLSPVLLEGKLYFHCALTGRKVDNLRHCPQVSFAAVGPTKPIYDGGFSTYFECVIASGTMDEVTDAEEKHRALYALAEKYLPDHMDKADGDIRKSFKATAVYCLTIESVTGKAKRPKA